MLHVVLYGLSIFLPALIGSMRPMSVQRQPRARSLPVQQKVPRVVGQTFHLATTVEIKYLKETLLRSTYYSPLECKLAKVLFHV